MKLLILQALIWLLVMEVVIPEATHFGYYGYNAKLGTCAFLSYCYVNYVYILILLAATVFVPLPLATGYAYFHIIRKLLAIRRKIEKRERDALSRASAITNEFEAIDSGVEMSQAAMEHPQGEAENDNEDELDNGINFVAESEEEENGEAVQAEEERESHNQSLSEPVSG